MEHRFHTINVPSQQRTKRIVEETWEACKEDILREFRSGGGQGVAQALRWIKTQQISGFNPKLVCLLSFVCRTSPFADLM
jgi:hypothetical protein